MILSHFPSIEQTFSINKSNVFFQTHFNKNWHIYEDIQPIYWEPAIGPQSDMAMQRFHRVKFRFPYKVYLFDSGTVWVKKGERKWANFGEVIPS